MRNAYREWVRFRLRIGGGLTGEDSISNAEIDNLGSSLSMDFLTLSKLFEIVAPNGHPLMMSKGQDEAEALCEDLKPNGIFVPRGNTPAVLLSSPMSLHSISDLQ